jgi:hypothetical protein
VSSALFVGSLDEYEAIATRYGGDMLPVLNCVDRVRVARWTRALDWYRSQASTSVVAARPSDVVVSLDEAFSPVARSAARMLGRTLVAANLKDVHEATRGATTALLIGERSLFGIDALDRVRSKLQLPWGLATAYDLPGASFFVAKMVAANEARLERAPTVVDVLTADDGREVARALGTHDDDLVILFAHGEAGHVNLESVVLCALGRSTEQDLSGASIDGCRLREGKHLCKRVREGGNAARVLSPADLPTFRLVILTCNGFSAASEMYPSDLTTTLAVADGLPARFLSSDRVVPTDPNVKRLALAAAVDESGLSITRAVLDDLRDGDRLPRTYALLGDPLSKAKPHRAVLQSIPSEISIAEVIGERPATVARGAQAIYVVSGTPARVVDRASELAALETRCRRIAARMARANSLARTLCSAFWREIQQSPKLTSSVSKLISIHHQLEVELQQLYRQIWTYRRTGLFDRLPLEEGERSLGAKVATWDELAARLLIGIPYLGTAQIVSALTDAESPPARTDVPCARCGLMLWRNQMSIAWLSDTRTRWECPACGFAALNDDDGGPVLSVTHPAAIEPKELCEFRLKLSPTLSGKTQISYELKDKARNVVLLAGFAATSDTTWVLSGEMPALMAADLHTLQVAAVRDLSVSLVRARIAGVRRDKR